MISTEEEIRQAMRLPQEGEHLEFKKAQDSFSTDKLIDYCCALANEGGGHIIFGVTDKPPREIVGSKAFQNLAEVKSRILEKLHIRVDANEIQTKDGRVVVFFAPGQPRGHLLQVDGRCLMRVGESLVSMTPDKMAAILAERTQDFSGEIVPNFVMGDLDPRAVQEFRRLWQRKSGNAMIGKWSDQELLENSELTMDGQMTYAALILMGGQKSFAKYLPQAELIFEYRSSEGSVSYQQRETYRQGFLLWFDQLWEKLNQHNDIQQYQDGLFRYDIATFDEKIIREAVLNAIGHRDYRDGGSVWVRQYPKSMDIESPGGFPNGITAENLLFRQMPRNRRLMEALVRCGFVERSGQGVDLMFQQSIRQSKPLPDYSKSDAHRVLLTIDGEIRDPLFIRFLERVGQETLASFTTQDFLALDYIHQGKKVPASLKDRLSFLTSLKVVEKAGHGKFMLSRKFHEFINERGAYTRKRGIGKEAEKALLMKHIEDYNDEGAPMADLLKVLPNRERPYIKRLLAELRQENQISVVGATKAARWFLNAEKQEQ